ncbi:MAG: GNAT family N-acetyltransferase [Planctomycetaceae bacterium]|nr:GNAT family N-acetyltransferase [Planctomycetaceae bacterium]
MSDAADSPSTLEIRQAVAVDVPALQAFLDPFVESGRLLPRTLDELNDLITHGFLAIQDGQIVGFGALEIYSSKLGEIRSLAVAEGSRGHGIGRRIVEACLQRARERRVFEVMAITSTDEFFRRCGFDFTLPGEKKALFLQTRDSYQ